MKAYCTPLVTLTEWVPAKICTVSVDEGWKEEWDENLTDKTESSDQV